MVEGDPAVSKAVVIVTSISCPEDNQKTIQVVPLLCLAGETNHAVQKVLMSF